MILLSAQIILSSAPFLLAQSFSGQNTVTKYDYLLNNPLIANAIVWEGGSGSTSYPGWSSNKKTQLQGLLNDLEANAPFPIINPPELTDDIYFSKDDAWMIYLTHLAHALWIEANSHVAWHITDFSSEDLALLLDSRTLLKYNGPDQYSFDWNNVMGRVTDWDIQFSYEFMEAHDFIKSTQDSTVYAFASWCRQYLLHIIGSDSNPDGYERLYGYRGYPLVNRILDPLPDTYGHISAGCWGTSGFFAAVMRSVNIPVIHAYAIFSTPGSSPFAHSRIELPTIDRGLCHSDDLYNQTCKPTGHLVPTEMLFPNLEWLEDFIADPVVLDSSGTYVNGKYDQALYNSTKHMLDLGVDYLTDYILYQRAKDDNEYAPPTSLDNLLIGPSVGGAVVQYAKPYFTESERVLIIAQVDEEIRRLGSGSWDTGKQVVRDRYFSSYEKDGYNTGVSRNEATRPQQPVLYPNFPNPFNSETVVRFNISEDTSREVKLTIYDLLGRRIRTLVQSTFGPGIYTACWDGRDDKNRLLSSGVYIVRLETVHFTQYRRMILLR